MRTPTAASTANASTASTATRRLSQTAAASRLDSRGRTQTRFTAPRASSTATNVILTISAAPYGVPKAAQAVTCAQAAKMPVTTTVPTLSAATTENLGIILDSAARRSRAGSSLVRSGSPSARWNSAPTQNADADR